MAKKKKTVERRHRTSPSRVARGPAAHAFKKPRSGGTRPGLEATADATEQARISGILEERQQLAEIVVSIMRGARHDCDIKQDRMASILGRSRYAITNMEKVRTDFALPDAIMWIRGINPDHEYLEKIFERLLFEVRKFYERRGR